MPDTYLQKPVPVDAVQFNDWISALEINTWVQRSFYVPEGADHPLRNKAEYNHKNDELFASATPFIVLHTSGKDIRVNPGSWIVKQPDGKIQTFTDDQFHNKFEARGWTADD